MLTAEAEPEWVRRAKALGAKGWIVKPLNVESLLAIVGKVAPPPALPPRALHVPP
jgi:AmiR/NasT family two-component response regulator